MAGSIRQRMQEDLPQAIKARDREAIAVLRTTLAAIANAEAIDPSGPVSAAGLLGDVARRELTEAEVVAIVHAELLELEQSITELRSLNQAAAAEALSCRARTLQLYLAGS